MEHKVIIQNLKCGGCANTIKRGLNELKGVSGTLVDTETSEVTFFCPDEMTETVLAKLDRLGYPPEDHENSILKQGKSYVSCMIGRVAPKED